jgi:hypothetical protein
VLLDDPGLSSRGLILRPSFHRWLVAGPTTGEQGENDEGAQRQVSVHGIFHGGLGFIVINVIGAEMGLSFSVNPGTPT